MVFLSLQGAANAASGDTAVFQKIVSGDLAAVRAYLDGGGAVNAVGDMNGSLLHYAVASDEPGIAEALIEHGANVNAKMKDGVTPLHVAGQLEAPAAAKLVNEIHLPDNPVGLALGPGGLVFYSRWTPSQVTCYNPRTRKVVWQAPLPDKEPGDVAYDGESIWAVGSKDRKLFRFSAQTGQLQKTYQLPGSYPTGVECAKGAIWVSDLNEKCIRKISPADGSVIRQIPGPGLWRWSIAYDGQYLWCSGQDKAIFAVNPETGSLVATTPLPVKHGELRGIKFNGRSFGIIENWFKTVNLFEFRGGIREALNKHALHQDKGAPISRTIAKLTGGPTNMTQQLLLAGADPSIQNDAGQTAHDLALACNDLPTLAALTEAEIWQYAPGSTTSAPNFTLSDLKGKQVTLAALRGKVVAIVMWGYDTRFPNDIKGVPEAAQELMRNPAASKGDLVVLAPTHRPKEDAVAYCRDREATFQVLLDPEGIVRTRFQVGGYAAVVIDRAGHVVWYRRSADAFDIALAVQRALSPPPPAAPAKAVAEAAREPVVFEDFEQGYANWTLKGDCWGKAPATDALYPGRMKGYLGHGFVCTMADKDDHATGSAVSRQFTIAHPYIQALVGGTEVADHCWLALVVDGRAVCRAAGQRSDVLLPICWDVRQYVGNKARLEIVDAGKAERDHLLVDQIMFTDSADTPPAYLHGFDPDDQEMARKAAALAPAWYRDLRASRVHVEATPEKRYSVRMTAPIRWTTRKPTKEYYYQLPPSVLTQQVESPTLTITVGKTTLVGRPIPTGHPVIREVLDCQGELPTDAIPQEGTVEFNCLATINRVKYVSGPPPSPAPDLTAQERRRLTMPRDGSAWSQSRKPEYQRYSQWIRNEKLARWPDEGEMAFIYRAICWCERHVNGGADWDGTPTTEKRGLLQEAMNRCGDCAGEAAVLIDILHANDIPCMLECGIGHCWALIFVDNIGWIRIDNPDAWPGWNQGPLSPTCEYGPWPFADRNDGDNNPLEPDYAKRDPSAVERAPLAAWPSYQLTELKP
jgi:outer membrane protein assembly factor BamB